MLNADGYCSRCTHWALDFPGLECPWCHVASADAAAANLGLDPDASPVEVLLAVKSRVAQVKREQRQLFALRARAARALIRRGNLADDVKAARTTLDAVERWALDDTPQGKTERRAFRDGARTRTGYEERLARREAIFALAEQDDTPERLRPSLGERGAPGS